MPLRIGDEAPNFTADTTEGALNFHEWIGDGYAILFSHPKDFTPVCTTELGYMAGLKPEFDKRNCKIIGLSIDSVADHDAWMKDIEETQGSAVNYPLIGDSALEVAKLYDMIHPNASGAAKERSAADITGWLSWFLDCLGRAIASAETTLGNVLFKAQLWDAINQKPVNARQRLIVNRMLEDDFEGFMNTSKYAKLTKCSNDTALRDIRELKERGILIQNPGGGRSTSYRLPGRDEQIRFP